MVTTMPALLGGREKVKDHMSTYLSVDIDYWTVAETAELQLTLMLRAMQGKVPIIAVMNHQQLLPEVNASGADTLVNIDEHSDLTDRYTTFLDCGSWVSYVKWRKTGRYLWVRPNRSPAIGACNGSDGWDSATDWDRTNTRYVDPGKMSIEKYLPDCVGIGICMSPDYATAPVIRVFKDLVKLYDLPYRKGRVKEVHRRRLAPPGVLYHA